MPEQERLFKEFSPVSTEEWLDKVKADLKGGDFEKKLVWKTAEGFNVKPYYRKEDIKELPDLNTSPGEFPFIRGVSDGTNEWYIRQDIKVKDAKSANQKALDILGKGITSLGFIFEENTSFTPELMEDLLAGIFCESIELNFYPQGSAKELLKVFTDYIKKKGHKPGLIKGAIETDPIGRYMVNGTLCIPVDAGLDYLAELVKSSGDLANYRLISIRGVNFNMAGSTIVQELGFSMAMGNEYLSSLTDRSIKPDLAASSMGFVFGVGSNYFMEIAKLRAARILWARIVNAYKPESVDSGKIYTHSVTSEWNKTIYDPYVNLLRTQTEAMSASLGGTDSLTVNSFDSAIREPGESSERIARNQQLLLMEESHFDKVKDPAAGSYYLENLTASIAEHAWNIFVDIEDKGGFINCLKEGYIQSVLKDNAKKRKAKIAGRKEKLLGTNIFPHNNEIIADGSLKAKGTENIEDTEIEPIQLFRASEGFENLRLATDNSERRPKVFLLTIGNPVMRKARAQFSSGFFGCAGYEVIDNNGFNNSVEGINTAIEEKADIIVLCSSDDEYAKLAPEVFKELAGRAILVIAGEPSCMEELKAKGLENFISMRTDLLRTLEEYNSKLGI